MPERQKKNQQQSRIQSITNFLKESAGLIAAIAALLTALALWLGRSDGKIVIFPTPTSASNCAVYKSGLTAIIISEGIGMQDLYFVPSGDFLADTHLLVFEEGGETVGMTQFSYNEGRMEFVLKSIVDERCYEVLQTDENVVTSIYTSNGIPINIILSDKKSYKLTLLLENNSLKAEFLDDGN